MIKHARILRLSLTSLFSACVLLSGCNQRELMKRMTPVEDEKLARSFLTQVIAGDTDAGLKSLSAQINAEDARKELAGLTEVFKHGEIKGIQVVGVFFRSGFGKDANGSTTELTLQLELSSGWFAGTVLTTAEQGGRKIVGARFQAIPDSLENINALNFTQKPLPRQAFLLLVVAVPLFVLYALVLCIRTRLPRKWPWILILLLGVCTLHLNWSTGEMSFQLLGLQLFGASCFRNGLVGPWVFGVSFPLGAVLFLIKRRGLIKKAAEASGESGAPV